MADTGGRRGNGRIFEFCGDDPRLINVGLIDRRVDCHPATPLTVDVLMGGGVFYRAGTGVIGNRDLALHRTQPVGFRILGSH